MSDYNVAFFDENIRVGLSAAEVVMPWVIDQLLRTHTGPVIDVGCGPGAWLSVVKGLGCPVHGVDGYAPDSHLLIDPSEFERRDLTEGVDCSGYDISMCLEVGEHLPESSSAALVAGLCKARYVFWSAAIPTQGGVNHVNEQWSTWWEPYFAEHGYAGSCDIRRVFWTDKRIAAFYRQNFVIWATPDDLALAGMSVGVYDEVHPERLGHFA
jgi:hypothetical protein